MIRSNLIARSTLSLALTLGVAGGAAMVATPAYAAKEQKPAKPAPVKLSKGFQAVAAPASQAIEAAKAKPAVVAATQKFTAAHTAYQQARGPAQAQAKGPYDAALAELGGALSAEKAQVDAAFALIENQDDRYTAGQLAVSLGGMAKDTALQRRGIDAMIQSGKATGADLAQLQFFAGSLAYDVRDFAAARTSLQAAITSGYTQNDVEALLAEAYLNDNQVPQGLTLLKQGIDRRAAAGTPAPVSWYRRGLGAAYKAKLLPQAAEFSMALVQAYPTTENWAGAITVVREIGKFPSQETLDLMRLMDRTKSYSEERDYIEYIQAADARRLPGEVQKVLQAGTAAGKLRGNDPFVTESRTISSQVLASDKASLPSTEKAARAATANVATVSGAADAFLSYGDAAKAEELYALALTKPGADAPRLLTRLGIAQADQGKFGPAKENFAKVTGPRQPIAQLWGIYAGSGGGAAPAAAKPAG